MTEQVSTEQVSTEQVSINPLVTWESMPGVIEEIESAFYDIPFENSRFQNETFVLASQLTPARAFRALGLKMMSKVQALKTAKYAKKRNDIDIRELKYKMSDPKIDPFNKERLMVDLEEKLEGEQYTNKLINDALCELGDLYAVFKRFPKITREMFEEEESVHFNLKLTRQVQGVVGAIEALKNMNHDVNTLMGKLETMLALDESHTDKLTQQ